MPHISPAPRALFGILARLHVGRRRAKKNHRANTARWAASPFAGGQYLCEQSAAAFGGMRYGWLAFKTNGCGAMAVYNALLHLGAAPGLPAVILHFERQGQMLFGLLGISPYAIEAYFTAQGYTSRTAADPAAFDGMIQSSDACVLSFWNSRRLRHGAHHIMLHPDPTAAQPHRIVVYNFRHGKKSVWFDNAAALLAQTGPPMLLCAVSARK